MNLIEQLKNNEKPFGLNTKEEQEGFGEAGKGNCLVVFGGTWSDGRSFADAAFDPDYTYRIKPDYQPEPEVEKCRVDPETLTYSRKWSPGYVCLHEALSDPDFMYFEYDSGYCSILPRIKGKPVATIPKYVVFRKATE